MRDDDDVFIDDGDDDDDEPKSPAPDADEDEDMDAPPARVKTAAISTTDALLTNPPEGQTDEDRPPPPPLDADGGSDMAKSQTTGGSHRPVSGQTASGTGQEGDGTPIHDSPLVSPGAVLATATAKTATIVEPIDTNVPTELTTVSPREPAIAEDGLDMDGMSDGDAKQTAKHGTTDGVNPSSGAGGDGHPIIAQPPPPRCNRPRQKRSNRTCYRQPTRTGRR